MRCAPFSIPFPRSTLHPIMTPNTLVLHMSVGEADSQRVACGVSQLRLPVFCAVFGSVYQTCLDYSALIDIQLCCMIK